MKQWFNSIKRRQMLNCILHAGQSICRTPQKCRSWTRRSPETVPTREQTRKQTKNNKSKTTKQKQQTNKTKTHNQNKNQTKTTEKGLQPAMGITCKMTTSKLYFVACPVYGTKLKKLQLNSFSSMWLESTALLQQKDSAHHSGKPNLKPPPRKINAIFDPQL